MWAQHLVSPERQVQELGLASVTVGIQLRIWGRMTRGARNRVETCCYLLFWGLVVWHPRRLLCRRKDSHTLVVGGFSAEWMPMNTVNRQFRTDAHGLLSRSLPRPQCTHSVGSVPRRCRRFSQFTPVVVVLWRGCGRWIIWSSHMFIRCKRLIRVSFIKVSRNSHMRILIFRSSCLLKFKQHWASLLSQAPVKAGGRKSEVKSPGRFCAASFTSVNLSVSPYHSAWLFLFASLVTMNAFPSPKVPFSLVLSKSCYLSIPLKSHFFPEFLPTLPSHCRLNSTNPCGVCCQVQGPVWATPGQELCLASSLQPQDWA